MSFQRRASAFDLGRRMDARFMARAGGGPPPFSYDDIPNQLLRISSLEGSLAFSGGTLTGVTDVSAAGETVNVTGSPTYTATDAGLNNAPSFTIAASSLVVAPNVDRASIRFVAAVFYRTAGTNNSYLWDGTVASGRHYGYLAGSATTLDISGATKTAPGEPSAGRKRLLIPNDGSTLGLYNGTALGSAYAVGSASGNGLTVGSAYPGSFYGVRCAFFMPCSAVPSAPLRAALEAKLITDFG